MIHDIDEVRKCSYRMKRRAHSEHYEAINPRREHLQAKRGRTKF